MKLRRILLEISLDDALQALNLTKSDLGDESKLKLAFRQAALKAHPDKGGSNEAMRDVNDAYELLKKQTNRSNSMDDWKRDREETNKLSLQILEILKSKVDYSSFVRYFNSVYDDIFTHKIVKEYPTTNEKYAYHASFEVQFSNPDRSIIFVLQLYCSTTDARRTSSLGSGAGNISFPLGVTAYGFYNNKKLKITQRDWTTTQNHDVLNSPELSFPKAKLEKFKGTSVSKVFKKSDMILYLTKKLGMTWDGQQARVKDVPKPLAIVFSRMTMLRTAAWSLNLYENSRWVREQRTVTFPETIETAQKIEDLVKKVANADDAAEIKSIVIKWSNTVKGFGD
jgi:curved DNA-binding protein CbpA